MNNSFILKLFVFASLSVLFENDCFPQLNLTLSSENNMICNGSGCNYEGPSILINEVMLSPVVNDGSIYGISPVGGGGHSGEWIELYNPDECNAVDISCYFLGNNAKDGSVLTDYPGGFLIPENTIVPPQGFCIIRGVNAPAVPAQHLVQNGGKTVEIVVNDIARICLGGGYRLWFPNSGGWFAFYDRNGVPQDAISWASQTNSCMTCAPCNPGAIGACNYTGSLAPYNSIPANRKTYIASVVPSGFTLSRIPDGGNWAINQSTTPTIGHCNSVCATPPIITCDGEAKANISGGTPPYSYAWNDGMAQTTQTAVGLCAGTYCVTVTDAANSTVSGCVIVQNHSLTVTASQGMEVCEGETITFSASSSPSNATDVYSWTGPDNFSSTNNSNQITNAYPSMSGIYSVTVSDVNTCSGSASVQMQVFPTPNAAFSASPLSGCSPVVTQFNNISTGGNIVSWNWNFGDGSISNNENPLHTYSQSGQYDVQLIVTTDKGCSDTLNYSDYIEVYPQPIADFYTVPEIGKTYEPLVTFYSNSIAQYWFWDFGDGNSSTSPPPIQHTYPGIDSSYIVTLILSNDYGCSDTLKKEFLVIDDELTFPNIITPNGDGINDKLEIINGHKYPNNRLIVFNRWGKKVFEQLNYQNDWDGGNLPDGTYYYIFYYLDKSYHTSLTILRN